MTRYWVMRTDIEESEYLFQELKKGRLRQGFGWLENLNLDVIRDLVASGTPLDEDQEDVWKHQRRMHPKEDDSIQRGDYIILPNLPQISEWSLVEVVGGYRYEIDPKLENYGHILEVKLLNSNDPINPYSKYVNADLRKTMRCHSRMWNIDDYVEDVEKLLSAIGDEEEITKPTSENEQILSIYFEVAEKLEKEIKKNFHGSEFEIIAEKLLKKIYQNVETRAGANEKGADFICTLTDGLGIDHRVAIQVKMWEGETDWERPLNQIQEAYNNYENISAGVILTTSDSISEKFEKKRCELEKDLNIPIKIIAKKSLTNAFLRYLPEFIEVNE